MKPDETTDSVREWPWRDWGRWALYALELLSLVLLGIWSLEFVLKYLDVAAETLDYPFHLEWMEGGVVETVQRVRDGKPFYVEPSVEYVSYIYTPLYFWVTAALSPVLGVSLFAARLVSFVSILACGAVLVRWVQREHADQGPAAWLWGLLAVALFFATYDASGRWFHLARVDSLGLALLVGGFYVLRFHEGWQTAVIAGLVLWLAYLAKQSSLVGCAPVLLVMLVTDTRRALVAGTVLTVAFGATVLIYDAITDGWFWYYTYEVGRAHETVETMWSGFWKWDVWRMSIAGGIGLLGLARLAESSWRRALFHLAVLLGMLGMSWLSRLHSGGYLNVLMPAFFSLSLACAVGMGVLTSRFSPQERERIGGSPVVIVLALLAGLQLLSLDYEIEDVLPPEGAVAQGEQYLRELAEIEGDVLIPDQRWVQTRVGKRSYGLGMAARDVLRVETPGDVGRRGLRASLDRALAERRFSAVILSLPDSMPGIDRYYVHERNLTPPPRPVTGWNHHPYAVWRPKPTPPTPRHRDAAE